MSNLIKLNNVQELINGGKEYSEWSSNKIISGIAPDFDKAIIKFDGISVCEVFGYQIASAIGVRVPRMQGFYSLETVGVIETGRIGILIEFLEDWKRLSRYEAADLDSEMTAKALALCVFDRHEWGEFGLSKGEVYFVDLERLLPIMMPGRLLNISDADCVKLLSEQESIYQRTLDIDEVIKEAESLGLKNEVEQEMKKLCALSPDVYNRFLQINGHPLDTLLSQFAVHNFGYRLNSIAEWFELSTHLVPDWK